MGRVHVAAWQAAYRGVMPDAYLDALDPAQREAMWAGSLGQPGLTVLVVEQGPTVGGFAALGAAREPGSPALGELYAINIDPSHWGQGLGTALLSAATETLRGLGFSAAVLWVVPTNARAIALYERHGWAPAGASRTDTVLGAEVPETEFRRSLGPTHIR